MPDGHKRRSDDERSGEARGECRGVTREDVPAGSIFDNSVGRHADRNRGGPGECNMEPNAYNGWCSRDEPPPKSLGAVHAIE